MKQQTIKIYRDGELQKWATYKQQIVPTAYKAMSRLKEIGDNARQLLAENRVSM